MLLSLSLAAGGHSGNACGRIGDRYSNARLDGPRGYSEMVARPSNLLILTVVFFVALAGTIIFGYRAGQHARGLRWENEPIRAWMSVPLIAHTHHVPRQILYQAIGVEPQPRDRRPLRMIAREQNRPAAALIRDLENALARAGHTHPAPPGGKVP